ncbi:hypothetical protein AALP_AA6G134200 [Arabis alpina]|uniref:AP2/ERF domain-containing protein n=1 Tax=Arabis alpina TaxID=50452 RepID=A0A087GNZ9_ARAAL|nr:hypothetical protein AALP_AA6G134200 [Arabis alpina]
MNLELKFVLLLFRINRSMNGADVRKKKMSSGYKGIRSRVWLGTFNSTEEAAKAYDLEAKRTRGAKAKLNFYCSLSLLPFRNVSRSFKSPRCAVDSPYGGNVPVFPRTRVWDPYKRLGIRLYASKEEIWASRNFLSWRKEVSPIVLITNKIVSRRNNIVAFDFSFFSLVLSCFH